jgi:choline dehydrogenase-like flavoprotein
MPYAGTPYMWARVRALGGKTLIWGRVALRLSDYDFKGKSHDGFGEDWPISYAELAPYYDKVDTLLGISGSKENLDDPRAGASGIGVRRGRTEKGKYLSPLAEGSQESKGDFETL